MSHFAVITGASKGLGKYLAKRFWVEGYSLCLVTRDSFATQELAKEFPERSDQTTYHRPAEVDLLIGNPEKEKKL